ncbi:SDR family oxidoreductase [Cohnella endophytica]|uniref:SDR family oxidoreductase n=1 Tax=Cohnella endophytica TaxID=2419778 RepID=A0A494XU42_9BACL|nr:3-oxoacyl-ACP reductase FabG [Cohnella endophytica]RKP54141.1 SDR family oxidoreductase [Cohnella endophytica]
MLNGQNFLVTGGTRGIGRSTVLSLAEAGANVAFTYRNGKEQAEQLYNELSAFQGNYVGFQADVQQFEEARQVIKQCKETLGGLDGLVLNAGITRDKLLFMMSEEDWDTTYSVNLKGTFNYARAAIFDFIKQKSGRIVCVSSISGQIGVSGQTNYSATKAGQIGFVKSLAKEVAKFGITVNAVAPGFIHTELWGEIPKDQREQILPQIPVGRPGTAEEVSNVIRFLLSKQASYVTGSVITIDGGLSA